MQQVFGDREPEKSRGGNRGPIGGLQGPRRGLADRRGVLKVCAETFSTGAATLLLQRPCGKAPLHRYNNLCRLCVACGRNDTSLHHSLVSFGEKSTMSDCISRSLALLSDGVLSRPTRHGELSVDDLSIKDTTTGSHIRTPPKQPRLRPPTNRPSRSSTQYAVQDTPRPTHCCQVNLPEAHPVGHRCQEVECGGRSTETTQEVGSHAPKRHARRSHWASQGRDTARAGTPRSPRRAPPVLDLTFAL